MPHVVPPRAGMIGLGHLIWLSGHDVNQGKNGARAQQVDWCSVCSNTNSVPVCCGSLFMTSLCSDPHL